MTTSSLKELFAELKQTLVPLVQEVSQKLDIVDDSVLHLHYAEKAQWDLGVEALKRIGFDFERGRLDKSVHPFTTSFSIHDVRMTTRIEGNYFPAAFGGTLHEGGHALYEQGVSPLRANLSSGRLWGLNLIKTMGKTSLAEPWVLEVLSPKLLEGSNFNRLSSMISTER
jgi:Zn-dependent M32 family carboxypeptidase